MSRPIRSNKGGEHFEQFNGVSRDTQKMVNSENKGFLIDKGRG